jgi:intracellular sulfur oxidation DsrE/DsrF family protein
MSKITGFLLALIIVTLGPRVTIAAPEQSAQNASDEAAVLVYPRFVGHGGVFRIDGNDATDVAAMRKVAFDVTESGSTSSPHAGLTHAARALNLFALAGVAEERVSIALVVHGDATPLVLSEEAYRRAHGEANPNTELLRRLREEGVKVKVCGQSLMHHGFSMDDVSPDVVIELSAMTALEELQRAGFALIP